jgi:hypothetical protein
VAAAVRVLLEKAKTIQTVHRIIMLEMAVLEFRL